MSYCSPATSRAARLPKLFAVIVLSLLAHTLPPFACVKPTVSRHQAIWGGARQKNLDVKVLRHGPGRPGRNDVATTHIGPGRRHIVLVRAWRLRDHGGR